MNNKLRFAIGTSDFKEVREGKHLWVDKSLFIKNVLDMDDKVTLVTRPRRFGKTLNMSMLNYFFDVKNAEENRQLFSGTKIEALGDEYMQHQGKYPVIFITLKDVKAADFKSAEFYIQNLITKLYMQSSYLLTGDFLNEAEKNTFNSIINKTNSQGDLTVSVQNLSEYLFRYYGIMPIILIDEYDTPINAAFCAKVPYHDAMIDFMVSFFGSSLKDNKFLKRAIVTGILKISQSNLFSGINNIGFCTLLDEECATDFGFTQSEVDDLFGLFKDREYDKELVKSWYNGYVISGTEIYNPWSITKCISKNSRIEPYWVESGETSIVKHVLKLQKSFQLQKDLKTLLDGGIISANLNINTVMQDLSQNRSALLTLLHFTGYLNAFLIGSAEQIDEMCDFKVPNREILGIYPVWLRVLFEDKSVGPSYSRFLDAISQANIAYFQDSLQEYLDCSVSYFDLKESSKQFSEQLYHTFVLGIIAGLTSIYIIESNIESGNGRFDIALIPRYPDRQAGFVFEFKRAEKVEDLPKQAQVALKQIIDRKYQKRFKTHNTQKFYAIGISFHKKQVEMEYEEISV
jgi:hypothetical protein